MTKVLIVKTTSMGDIFHALPALTDLSKHFDNLEISWLAENTFSDIPAFHPAVSSVIESKVRIWRRSPFSSWFEILSLRSHLSNEDFDIAIDCQGLVKSALLCRMTGKRTVKCGYDRHCIRERLASFFYDKTYSVDTALSLIDFNRQLFAQAFGYSIDSAPDFGIRDHMIKVFKIMEKDPVPFKSKFWLGFAPSSKREKMWDGQNWLDLGRYLFDKYGLIGYLSYGSQDERTLIERIVSESDRTLEVLPKLKLDEIAAVILKSEFCLGVDTGLTHFANALNEPTIVIHNFKDSRLTPKLTGDKARTLYDSPNVKQVIDSVESLLESSLLQT